MRSFFEFLFHELVLEIWEKTTMEEFFMKTKVFVIGFFFAVFLLTPERYMNHYLQIDPTLTDRPKTAA